jgi:hypothetical protein
MYQPINQPTKAKTHLDLPKVVALSLQKWECHLGELNWLD